ncbi:MAG: shikimate kinase, partial [Verrucomicrobiota bacterium]|nr:shikimate kinase [Verrucomicrobiota bacterium]
QTLLRALGTIVYLRADQETLATRVEGDSTRPLLRTTDRRQTIANLLRDRESLYARLADAVIDTTSSTPAQVADTLLKEPGWRDERRLQTRTR